MMLLLLSGKRVFGMIGFVAAFFAALMLWGDGRGRKCRSTPRFVLFNWYPMLTLPLFVYMGYMLVRVGDRRATSTACSMCGWVRCTAGSPSAQSCLMVVISAMNGLSVAGHGDRRQHRAARDAASAATTRSWSPG
jgi:hypothetical protein